ncbi:MAG: hypothetical protein DI597_20250 [Pseudoxanthomonas spadix]|nr:MAG: hypothetical protein DI597_20250 [Pseudoxanthomonas spadix]
MKKYIEHVIKLIQGKRKGEHALQKAKAATALATVGEGIIEDDEKCRPLRAIEYRSMSDYDATEALARTLRERLGGNADRFNLLTCSKECFKQLWKLRQVIDCTGIPYPIYVDIALELLRKAGKRRIRLSMLSAMDVTLHVMHRYRNEVPSYLSVSDSRDGSKGDSVA